MFGSIFIARLDKELLTRLPEAGLSAKTLSQSPVQIQRIADPFVRNGVIDSFSHSLVAVFAIGIPLCLVGLAISFFMPEHPLRDSATVGLTEGDEPKPAITPMR